MLAEDLIERFQHLGDAQILDLVDGAGEVAPELAEHVLPADLVVGDAVELLLEVGGEVVLNVAGEETLEESRNQTALVLGDQPALVDADIVAVDERLQRRRIGRRPADAEFFHLLDQRRLGVARRRLGEVLVGGNLLAGQRHALIDRGQAGAVLALIIVAAFLIERQETVEADDLAGGAKPEPAAVMVGGDVNRGAFEIGGLHLARQRAFPDQRVELGLFGFEKPLDIARRPARIGRPDRLVRFLGVLGLGLVDARGVRNVA